MATKQKSSSKPRLVNNPWVRILGEHKPAQQVLQQAAHNSALPIQVRAPTVALAAPAPADYILLDPALVIEPAATGQHAAQAMPSTGIGYAAFTPSQRYALLQWLNQPTEPAAPAFQHFYLAHLEVGLVEQANQSAPPASGIEEEVARLQQSPAWHQHVGLARLRLLTDWLLPNASPGPTWLPESLPAAVLGVALGLQALRNQALQPQQLPLLFEHWAIETSALSSSLLTLRLSSLTATLGMDPLAYALDQLAESARAPQPWRSHHRDLRLALPQPDLRPTLEPLLRDLVIMPDEPTAEPSSPAETGAVEPAPPAKLKAKSSGKSATKSTANAAAKWQLVLEFGESRSDLFIFALNIARQQPGYVALLDEDRRMVHRIHFQKSEIRRFWRLWEYVQSWSTTKVYLNGDEVNKWELYARL